MSAPFERNFDDLMNGFKEHLERWNPQINLVSRKGTSDRIESLFEQALLGIDALAAKWAESDWPDPGRLKYFDLGSGGGIPGVVWHCRLAERGLAPETCLVEPREKRAWFLERAARISGMPAFGVLCDRWGEDDGEEGYPCLERGSEEEPEFGATLISLKALRLTDSQILSGLSRMGGGSRWRSGPLWIARYHPPEQELNAELAETLKIPDPGTRVGLPGVVAVATGHGVERLVGAKGPCASLILSYYIVNESS